MSQTIDLSRDVYALNRVMEFDHVIQVHADGTVTDAPQNYYAPTLNDGELDDPRWSLFTQGYSGQWLYSGPIMHQSEFIGGGLARDILSEPGIYVALVSYIDPDPEDESEEDADGWAVARYDG